MSVSAVSSQRAVTAQPSHNEYTIQRGDTLSAIAARHGVSLGALEAANPQVRNPNVIYPGDRLTIPSGGHANGPANTSGTGNTQAASATGGATPNTQQGRINEAMGFFESKGWTRAQAAGIVGNLQAESGVNPNRGQDGGGPGYGLAQWEGPRQRDFKAWSGHDIHQSTFHEQLEFIQHELTTTERGAGNALKGATTASQAAQIVCNKYERPGIPHMDARIANANAIYNNASPTNNGGGSTPSTGGNNGSAPKPAPANGGNYTVRSGDTMSAIASRHGVSLAALKAANPQIRNINLIHPGQTVHIPGGAKAGTPASSNYIVRSGDTMSSIASHHGVSLSALVAANSQIKNPNRIYPGQTVHLPGGKASSGSSGSHGTTGTGQTNAPSHVNGVNSSQKLANDARSVAMSMGGYHSQGLCATGVSRAIQKAYGIKVWGNGNQIDDNLPRNKFKQIDIPLSEALKIPGLVLTWEKTSTALGSKYGHTAITLGDGHSSASDFIENNTIAGNASRSGLKIFMPI